MNKINKAKFIENVKYILRDSKGQIVKLYKENKVARFFRKIGLALPKSFLFGSMVSEMTISNLVTNAGLQAGMNLVGGVSGINPFNYIGIGLGTTAPVSGNTQLESEISSGGGERQQDVTPTLITTSVSNDTLEDRVTYNFTSSFAVTESGLFNDTFALGGVMFARQTFAPINVNATQSLEVVWRITGGTV